jgi:protein tyrosine phosphatase (PTP) superfamily phosphohydrolase (DUF442 family)
MPSRFRIHAVLFTFAVAAMTAWVAAAVGDNARETASKPFAAVTAEHLHNVHRISPRLISGSAPDGEGGFEELRRLGVRTIISVDGARPDADLARKFGMRYVHLPVGYDDIAPQEGRALAKALDELEGPIYLHCHHGKHRSAAALAVACVINGQLRPQQAESVLLTFGTGENYRGLWASARAARPLAAAELSNIRVDYVPAARVPPLAEAMVSIDETWERLKLAEKSAWQSPPVHPDVDPAHEALQLMEKLRELGRTPAVAARPADFKEGLARSEEAARVLHESLAARAARNDAGPAEAAPAMKTISNACSACHAKYRD